jgi:hypothetical protein
MGTYSFISLNFFSEPILVYIAVSKNKNKNRPNTIGSFMKTIGSLKVFEMNRIDNSLIVKCFQKLETSNYLINSLKQIFHFIQSFS